jgi:nicotinamide-nucleotide amidase
MTQTHDAKEQDADQVGAALKRSGRTLAVAESLTGGLLAGVFARTSGSSEWFRGGVVAYSSAVKHDLLEVPDGPVVSAAAARAMASGAGRLLGADVAVAVTGVGGPGQQDGQPPGTVWAATWPDQLGDAVLLRLSGSPESICEQVCTRAVRLLRDRLEVPLMSRRAPGTLGKAAMVAQPAPVGWPGGQRSPRALRYARAAVVRRAAAPGMPFQ